MEQSVARYDESFYKPSVLLRPYFKYLTPGTVRLGDMDIMDEQTLDRECSGCKIDKTNEDVSCSGWVVFLLGGKSF